MTLYSKDILQRSKQSVALEKPSTVTHRHRVSNPICGDRVEWQLHIVNQDIIEAWVDPKGCALCKASASLLSEGLIGSSTGYLRSRVECFMTDIDLILRAGHTTREASLFEALAMAPARQECVLLPWKCIEQVLSLNNTPE